MECFQKIIELWIAVILTFGHKIMNKNYRVIPKDLEKIIRNSERPEAPFANKNVVQIVNNKKKEYDKIFNEMSEEISNFHANHLIEVADIMSEIKRHLEVLKKNNYQDQMLQWEHINKFEDNIKSTIELTVFTQHDLTIPNHYNLNLVEWHYFYKDDNMDSDLFSIDITIDNKNIRIDNNEIYSEKRYSEMLGFSSSIFKYLYLGGNLEDFNKPPTYL